MGWALLCIGIVVLVQEFWRYPRSMAKVREKMARGGDPRKFDAFLGSGRHRLLQWFGLAMGVGMIAVGLLALGGVGNRVGGLAGGLSVMLASAERR